MIPPVETAPHAKANGANGAVPPARTLDSTVALVKIDPAALLSDDVVDFAAGLSELDGARLRQRLGAERIKIGDFSRIVKARQKEQAAAERTEEAERRRGEPDDWHGMLRRDKMTGFPRASLYNLKVILEQEYSERLSFDEMASVPLIDGKPIEDSVVTGIRCDLEENEDLEFSRATTEEAVVYVARQNAFHPVRQYLRSIVWDKVNRIERVAAEYLGAQDPLSAKLAAMFFRSAVARAEEPGCKVDNALVLFGDEGWKKSSFFRALGGGHFKDSKVDITDRKGMMLMHSAWIYEWPEVDRMLEKKHDSDVKAYVTQQDDSFVPMYGRSVTTLDRSNVTVGTTNKEKFITSDTGSRRWWVITVSKVIDVARLRAERDQLWAEAVAMFDEFKRLQKEGTPDDKNPLRWWLTEDEEKGRAERNEEHLTASPDVEAVDSWLRGEPMQCVACKGTGDGFGFDRTTGAANDCATCGGSGKTVRAELPKDPRTGREYVTQALILNGPLAVPPERHEMNRGRVTSALRRLHWRSGARIYPNGRNGARVVPYYSPEPDPEADEKETGVHESQEAPA